MKIGILIVLFAGMKKILISQTIPSFYSAKITNDWSEFNKLIKNK